MKKMFEFFPTLQKVGSVPAVMPKESIENEPMLFSAGWMFAHENGGPITKAILKQIYDGGNNWINSSASMNLVIDTRVHMLMPGWYPAIPGWHCDFIPRSGPRGQPVLDAKFTGEVNYTCIVGTESCLAPTEFISDTISVIYSDQNVWRTIDNNIESIRFSDEFRFPIWRLDSGDILLFGSHTLHRAVPATAHGWRYFFRCSLAPHIEQENQVRKQVQAYIPLEKSGW